jgi:hypothetical protein
MPNNFTYNAGVPASPNNPSADQPEMLLNTISIGSLLAVDHFSFNTNGGGIHKQVRLLNQTAPGLGDGNGVLYANLSGGQSRPFWQDAITSYPIALITTTGTSIVQDGYITIGGLILQWASKILDNNGQTIRNDSPFLFNIPFPNNVFSIQLSAGKSSTGAEGLWVTQATLTTTGFSIKTSASSGQLSPLYYFAIGN